MLSFFSYFALFLLTVFCLFILKLCGIYPDSASVNSIWMDLTLFCTSFFFFRAALAAYDPQTRGQIGATATATWDPSHICDLHHGSRQQQIPDSLSEARDQTCILMDTSLIHFHCTTTGTPCSLLLFSSVLFAALWLSKSLVCMTPCLIFSPMMLFWLRWDGPFCYHLSAKPLTTHLYQCFSCFQTFSFDEKHTPGYNFSHGTKFPVHFLSYSFPQWVVL